MFLRELKDPLPSKSAAAVKAGITDAGALLCRFPRDWEDRSVMTPLARWPEVCTVVKVLAHDWFGFGRMRTLKVYVEDESARAVLVCFNRPYLEKQLQVGCSYRLWGRFFYKYGEIQSSAFETEPLEGRAGKGFGRILPVYPLSAGLTQTLLRRLVERALAKYAPSLEDELPQPVIQREGLLSKAEAVRAIHFPNLIEEKDRARKTLIYEELFYLEIMVGRRALERRSVAGNGTPLPAPRSPLPAPHSPLQQHLMERLPFRLTAGQLAAADEINRDMDGPYPMARLLQGDVGSGKTLVSFLAGLRAVEAGGQAALMAPTELLARQHAENAARLLEPLGLRIAFLTGNIKAAGRKELLKNLAAGEIDFVVGTHALFSADVLYKNLRLVIVDEQHRFGVTQRQAIMAKGDKPDLLMMSATPIPRTLALTVFGDMDVSVIRDMPPGRKPVETRLFRQSNAWKVYNLVQEKLAAGQQAYFVYPLIESGDGADLKDAVSMVKRLGEEVFPRFPAALIHSRLPEEEKRSIMDRFRAGEIKVLAATSVVEVGVDVPNATCMVIEHADRFGLSALHQLRGRVGRGTEQSFCFLVYSDPEGPLQTGEGAVLEDWQQRLKVMKSTTDGFVIAEEDLKLRGPGQIAGTEQSGYLSLGIADPVRDAEALARARTDAFTILESDPAFLQSEHRCIAEVLDRAPPFSRTAF